MKRPEDMSREELVGVVKRIMGRERLSTRLVMLALGVTPMEAKILLHLAEAEAPITGYQAMQRVTGFASDGADALFKVHVCKIRAKLGKDVIETVRPARFLLTDLGRRMIEDATGLSSSEAA